MKVLLVAAFLIVALSVAYSTPIEDIESAEDLMEYEGESVGIRLPRMTCDHTRPAASESSCYDHCRNQGKAGGRCRRGLCQCERYKSKDVIEEAFSHF